MNCRWIVSVPVLGMLSSVLTFPQSNALSRKYTVYDLGPAGNPFSSGSSVNNRGVVVGSDTVSDGGSPTSHAVLWYGDLFLDLKQIADTRQPGLLGPNSAAGVVKRLPQLNRAAIRKQFESRFTARRMALDYLAAYRSLTEAQAPRIKLVSSAE